MKRSSKIILVVFIVLLVGAIGYFLMNQEVVLEKFQELTGGKAEQKEDVIDLSYNYIHSNLGLTDYKYNAEYGDPVEKVQTSGVTIVNGENRLTQEGFATARFWDLIYTSYLYGTERDKKAEIAKAKNMRDFFYANTVPLTNENYQDNLTASLHSIL